MQTLTVHGKLVHLHSLDGGASYRRGEPQRWAIVQGLTGKPRRVRWEHITIHTRDADEWED